MCRPVDYPIRILPVFCAEDICHYRTRVKSSPNLYSTSRWIISINQCLGCSLHTVKPEMRHPSDVITSLTGKRIIYCINTIAIEIGFIHCQRSMIIALNSSWILCRSVEESKAVLDWLTMTLSLNMSIISVSYHIPIPGPLKDLS